MPVLNSKTARPKERLRDLSLWGTILEQNLGTDQSFLHKQESDRKVFVGGCTSNMQYALFLCKLQSKYFYKYFTERQIDWEPLTQYITFNRISISSYCIVQQGSILSSTYLIFCFAHSKFHACDRFTRVVFIECFG